MFDCITYYNRNWFPACLIFFSDFTAEQVPVILAPVLYPEPKELPADRLVARSVNLPSSKVSQALIFDIAAGFLVIRIFE